MLRDVLGVASVVAAFFLAQLYSSNGSLTSGGTNVCTFYTRHVTYFQARKTRIGYDNYRTCCSRFLGICTDRCTRYRTKVVTYYETGSRTQLKPRYRCCLGWSQIGNQCPKPICNPTCKNGAHCSRPNTCDCPKLYLSKPSFKGRYCEQDVNECVEYAPRPCDQVCQNLPGRYVCSCNKGYMKTSSNSLDRTCRDINECTVSPCKCTVTSCKPQCINMIGSYHCLCPSGFRLAPDKHTCFDIDECASKISLCAQNCHNQPGSYYCSCQPGYKLIDGGKCTDINECKSLNGGCNQKCVNSIGSFICQCDPGYFLQDNQRTCADVDECIQKRPCDNVHGTCRNFPGSYSCGCKVGFLLQPDKKTCFDMDECKANNGCLQNCHNNVGSYTCSCEKGYRLNSNQRTCDDIDECKEKLDTCEHNCRNTIASYKCSCRPGYKLAPDNRKCIALPCERITKPLNGSMSCTGFVTDQTCSFSCDSGFDLVNSAKRTCQPSATWSGVGTFCKRKTCPTLKPPEHGSLLLPCIELFASSCVAKCNQGSYLVGSKSSECIMKNGVTVWSPNNAVCKESMPCYPNPCEHGGKCSETSGNKFTCECSGTNYIGSTCDIGIVIFPSIPQLTVGEYSEELTVRAFPDNVLEIRPLVDSEFLKFTPEKLVVHPERGEVNFKVNAQKQGVFHVRFQLVGANAPTFQNPGEITVYAYTKSEPLQPVEISTDFHLKSCKEKSFPLCNGKVKMSASCQWSSNSARGIVSVRSEKLPLPFSLIGITEKQLKRFDRSSFLYPMEQVKSFMKADNLPSTNCLSKCPGVEVDANSIKYIMSENVFQRAYYSVVNQLLPHWFRLKVDEQGNYFDAENFLSALGSGAEVSKVKFCNRNWFKNSSTYSVYLSKSTTDVFFASSVKQVLKSTSPMCIGVDLCQEATSVTFPKSLVFDPDLKSAGLGSIKLSVNGFGYGTMEQKCIDFTAGRYCLQSNSFWDATSNIELAMHSSTLNFNGTFLADLDEQSMQMKLDRQTELAYFGVLDFQININVLSGNVKIQGTDKNSSGLIKVGGVDTCPLCKEKGVKLSVNIPSSSFSYDANIVKFLPQSRSEFYFPYDINGGSILEVENKRILSSKMTSASRLVSIKLNEIYSAVQAKELEVMKKFGDATLKALQSVVTVLSESQPLTDTVLRELEMVRDVVAECKSQVNSLAARHKNNAKLALTARVLRIKFKQMLQFKAEFESKQLSVMDFGKIISYKGRFCLHSLCISDSNVTIYDLSNGVLDDPSCGDPCKSRYSPYLSADSVMIGVIPTKDIHLSERITFKTSDQMKIVLSKHSHKISGTFTAHVKYFDRALKTTFEIKDGEVGYTFDGVELTREMTGFTLSNKVNLATASWNSLIYLVNGVNYQLAKDLKFISQKVYENISLATTTRLKETMDRVKETQASLADTQNKLTEMKQKCKLNNEEYLFAEAAYKDHTDKLSKAQLAFDAQLKDLDENFIKRTLSDVCPMETCKEKCISIPICLMCQEPLMIDTLELKCVDVKVNTKVEREVPFTKTCPVVQPVFHTVYTGSCSPDPAVMKRADAERRKALMETGGAVGALIGSVFGPLGTAIGGVVGAAIGAIINFIGGLFNSCDESYEVVRSNVYSEVPCVEYVKRIVQVTRLESTCENNTKVVQAGFSSPKTCNCTINPCVVKSKNVTCVTQNKNCFDLRQKALKESKSIPETFTKMYSSIEEYEENMETSLLKMHTAEKSKKFCEREVDRLTNIHRVQVEESKFADKSYRISARLLKTEVCIMEQHRKAGDLSTLINFKNVQFNVALPVIDSVRLNIDTQHASQRSLTPFVYEFQNSKEQTLKSVARKLLTKTFCQASRKRRSLEVEVDELDLTFKPWFVQNNVTLSKAKLSCYTLEKALKFLKNTIISLNDIVNESIDLNKKIVDAELNLIPTLAYAFSAFTEVITVNSVVKANRDLLASSSRELTILKESTSTKSALKRWLEKAEVYTGFSNMSVCLGFKDCVKEAIEVIQGLPKMWNNDVVPRMNELSSQFTGITTQGDIQEISKTITNIREILNFVDRSSFHCKPAPEVKLITHENVTLKEGEEYAMKCSVRSSTPAKLYWTLNEKVVEWVPLNSALKITATKETEGVYQCFAVNDIGRGNGSSVVVRVVSAPAFKAEPVDATYVIPSDKEVQVTFSCNATGTPEPKFKWFHRQLSSRSEVRELKGETKPLLVFGSPVETHSGFYYCEVSNEHGKLKSREARFDVLDSVIASAEVKINFVMLDRHIVKQSFYGLIRDMLKEFKDSFGSIDTQVNPHGNNTQVTFLLWANPPTMINKDIKHYLMASSKVRQNTAGATAVWVEFLMAQRGVIYGPKLDQDSVSYAFHLNICKPGYQLHENGFMCVQCPHGTAGKGCKTCAVNSFAEKRGLTACVNCGPDKITEREGATNASECIDKRKRKSDIFFLVDSSKDFMSDWMDVEEVKRSIHAVMRRFDGGDDTRYGLVTYDTDTITIAGYQAGKSSKGYLVSRLGEIQAHPNRAKKTYVGLKEVRRIFQKKSSQERKKILIVFTNGHSEDQRRLTVGSKQGNFIFDGFLLTRDEAKRLQRNEVHIISISGNRNIDYAELFAIASFPKRSNSLILLNINDAAEKIVNQMDQYLHGGCMRPNIDFGVLLIPQQYQSIAEFYEDENKLLDLLGSIHVHHSNQSFYFSTDKNHAFIDTFAVYSKASFLKQATVYNREQSYRTDVFEQLSRKLPMTFTEQHESLAEMKVLVIITNDPLSEKMVKKVNEKYLPGVHVVNFARSYVDLDADLLVTVEDRLFYNFKQVHHFIEFIDEKRNRKCESR